MPYLTNLFRLFGAIPLWKQGDCCRCVFPLGNTVDTEGTGHFYQGRLEAFPIEEEHLLTVLRYVERNALQANLVEHAEDWKYGSLWRVLNGDNESVLSPWPIPRAPITSCPNPLRD